MSEKFILVSVLIITVFNLGYTLATLDSIKSIVKKEEV
jgi:hypothetical protein